MRWIVVSAAGGQGAAQAVSGKILAGSGNVFTFTVDDVTLSGLDLRQLGECRDHRFDHCPVTMIKQGDRELKSGRRTLRSPLRGSLALRVG